MSITFKKDSKTDWEERIIKELKGRPFEDLLSQTSDGIEIKPFYSAGQEPIALGKGSGSPWRIRQEFFDGSNSHIMDALEAGVDSISVDAERLEGDLEGVQLDIIDIEVGGEGFHPAWVEYLRSIDIQPNKLRGGYAWDPLMGMLQSGDFDAIALMPKAISNLRAETREWENWYLVHIQGDQYHNAGASPVQELAYTLAQLAEYFNYADDISAQMVLSLAASTDYFETVSKLRAMRILWANLLKVHGRDDTLQLFARSSIKDLAPVDQHGNLLRATSQCMASIGGGADRVTLHPFDGTGDAFSFRMARNIQKLLVHETYMDKVLDPLHGAYLFEDLTGRMAKDAWALFKQIEEAGGWAFCVIQGRLQDETHRSAEQWAEAVNSGERTWLGVNKYPDVVEPAWKGMSVEREGKGLPYFKNEFE